MGRGWGTCIELAAVIAAGAGDGSGGCLACHAEDSVRIGREQMPVARTPCSTRCVAATG